jgi:Flp pilus assembly protein TadD
MNEAPTPTQPDIARWEQAASLLEQSVRIAKPTTEASYLLAMCYKRLGKRAEARAALHRIVQPDANVLLQLGVLALEEGEYEQADQEFTQALRHEPRSFSAAYNMLVCRLSMGRLHEGVELLPRLLELARSREEKRLFSLLGALVQGTATVQSPRSALRPNGDFGGTGAGLLAGMTPAEEQALLRLLEALPRRDVVFPLLQRLAWARPESEPVQQTYLEMVLVHARRHAERCQWSEADELLAPLSRLLDASPYSGESNIPNDLRIAFLNVQGCCACMLQDFERAFRCFSTATKWASDNAWLYQNLALALELQGRMDLAEAHWDRYFDLLGSKLPTPPAPVNYQDALTIAGLFRLGELYTKHERWGTALGFVQRAHRLRPRDLEILEKLFHLYVQVRRPEDARRTLRKMRELRPDDPQMDLYELDLREVRTLEDLDRMLGDIKRVLGKHPGDMRVEDRAVSMVANCVPMIGRRCDQLSQQLGHIVDQVRKLPNYQINWPVVHDEMHHLRHEFQKLRRLSNKCLALVSGEEQRKVIRDLNAHIDSKIDICISMGG